MKLLTMSYILSHFIHAVLGLQFELRSNWPIPVSFSLSDDQISRMGTFSAKRTLSSGGIATGALAYKLNIHTSFLCTLRILHVLAFYPKSEIVSIQHFSLLFFRLGAGRGCSWADSGTGRVYCQQCCRGAHQSWQSYFYWQWKWCGWLERFLISLLMTVLGSECGKQEEGLSRPDGLFETNTCLFDVE